MGAQERVQALGPQSTVPEAAAATHSPEGAGEESEVSLSPHSCVERRNRDPLWPDCEESSIGTEWAEAPATVPGFLAAAHTRETLGYRRSAHRARGKQAQLSSYSLHPGKPGTTLY